jgi:LPXTG-motif cell wall-anchored protein
MFMNHFSLSETSVPNPIGGILCPDGTYIDANSLCPAPLQETVAVVGHATEIPNTGIDTIAITGAGVLAITAGLLLRRVANTR